MRLLARIPVETEMGTGNFNIFFVKKDRLFAVSDKFHFKNKSKSAGTGSAQVLIKHIKDKYTVIDFCFTGITDSVLAKALSYVIIDYIKNTLMIEDIQKKYNDISSNSVVPMVRPLNKCTYSTYTPHQQSFGVMNSSKQLAWKHCREQFANDFTSKTNSIFFCTMEGTTTKDFMGARLRTRRIARFIRRIEEILKLKDYSVCIETSSYNVMEIEPNNFWTINDLRRSLFTILPRAGLLYDFKKDNYLEALKGYTYSAHTINAITRFLDGHTKYTGEHRVGWQNTFYGMDDKAIAKVLVKGKIQ